MIAVASKHNVCVLSKKLYNNGHEIINYNVLSYALAVVGGGISAGTVAVVLDIMLGYKT